MKRREGRVRERMGREREEGQRTVKSGRFTQNFQICYRN